MTSARRGLALAVGAAACFGTAPVLIRAAGGVPAWEVAFWRLAVASGAVLAAGVYTRTPLALRPADRLRFALYGATAAAHFVLYIAALSYTTIAHAATLVYTAPAWIAVLSALVLRERLSALGYAGIAVAMAGVAILAGFEPRLSPRVLAGDALALVSAVAFAIYSVAGRRERHAYPLLAYAFWVYLAAAVALAIPAASTFDPAHYTPGRIMALLALGLVPLALGHTLYNASVRSVSATVTNLISTQEVTLGIALGALFLAEIPSWTSLAGAAVALAGVALVLLAPGVAADAEAPA